MSWSPMFSLMSDEDSRRQREEWYNRECERLLSVVKGMVASVLFCHLTDRHADEDWMSLRRWQSFQAGLWVKILQLDPEAKIKFSVNTDVTIRMEGLELICESWFCPTHIEIVLHSSPELSFITFEPLVITVPVGV